MELKRRPLDRRKEFSCSNSHNNNDTAAAIHFSPTSYSRDVIVTDPELSHHHHPLYEDDNEHQQQQQDHIHQQQQQHSLSPLGFITAPSLYSSPSHLHTGTQQQQQQQHQLLPSHHHHHPSSPPLVKKYTNNNNDDSDELSHYHSHSTSTLPTTSRHNNNNNGTCSRFWWWLSSMSNWRRSNSNSNTNIFYYWKYHFYIWLYPSNVPMECQLFRQENMVIPMCYLLVGMLQGLSAPLVNVLPIDLHANESQQAIMNSIRSLPASFKLLFGFLSDVYPIRGYRRKPYMTLGWIISSSSLLFLLLGSNLQKVQTRDSGCFISTSSGGAALLEDSRELLDSIRTDVNITSSGLGGSGGGYGSWFMNNYFWQQQQQPNIGPPSIPFLAFCFLWYGIGYWLADVMGDSIVAERTKYELPEHKGTIQSTCYACRFFGKMIAAPVATYMYSVHGPYPLTLLLCIMPLTILPCIYVFHEKKIQTTTTTTSTQESKQQHQQQQPILHSTGDSGRNGPVVVLPVREQCEEIWRTVCQRAVWQPMLFVYLYNIMQVSNAAWKEFLVTVLHFTSCQLNLLLITSYVLLYVGVIVYKNYFMNWSWRTIYIITTMLNGLLSLLQILLIKGITFGWNPFYFTLGDDAFMEFILGIQFLPTTIMMVNLCPVGSEGASYAMFTTVSNSASTLSTILSTQLLKLWDVSKPALQRHELSGLLNLTYLTTTLQVVAIIFVGLLPHYKDDVLRNSKQQQQQQHHKNGIASPLKEIPSASSSSSSKIGGFTFLLVTFGSILYAVVVGLLSIVAPKWMGVS